MKLAELVIRDEYGMPLICWRCGKAGVSYVNITASACASAGSNWKPVCSEHGGGPPVISRTAVA